MKKLRNLLLSLIIIIFSISFIGIFFLSIFASSHEQPISFYINIIKNKIFSQNDIIESNKSTSSNNTSTSSNDVYRKEVNYDKAFTAALEYIRKSTFQSNIIDTTSENTTYFNNQYASQKKYFEETMKRILSTNDLQATITNASIDYTNPDYVYVPAVDYTYDKSVYRNFYKDSRHKIIDFYNILYSNSIKSFDVIYFTIVSMEPKHIYPVDTSEGGFHGFLVKYYFTLVDENNFVHEFGNSKEPISALVGNNNSVLTIVEPW